MIFIDLCLQSTSKGTDMRKKARGLRGKNFRDRAQQIQLLSLGAFAEGLPMFKQVNMG